MKYEPSKEEKERGYTDAQRNAALEEPHMKNESAWLKVVRDPWPNKPLNEKARES